MRIHHVGYLTKNISKAEAAFAALGYGIERPVKHDSIRQINITFMVNDDYRVELIEPDSKESPMYPLLKKYKNTPYHFCYITEDLDKEIEILKEIGYMVIQEPEKAPCIDDKRVCFLVHKDMGIIELVER